VVLKLQPLSWDVPIVDYKTGFPTPEFMRKWAQQFAINGVIPAFPSVGILVQSVLGTFTARSITGGTGITITNGNGAAGNPTVTLADTVVAPGTYGDSTHTGQFTVDQQGRLTFAANVAISGVAPTLEIEDEGVPLTTTPTSIDFVGAGVTATVVGTDVTVTIPGGGGGSSPEWNDNDAWMASIVLHRDGVTITGAYNGAGDGSIRAGASQSTGKFYFEFLVLGVSSSHFPIIGIGSATAALDNFPGNDAQGWAIGMGTFAWHGGATINENAYVAGDIVGIAVDFTAATGSVNFYKNNVAQLNAYTGLTLGTMFPMCGMRAPTNTTQGKGTLRLKAAEQTYAPPAGYSSWS
jgi:SPRY domain